MQHTPSDTQTQPHTDGADHSSLRRLSFTFCMAAPAHFLGGELMEQMDVNSKFPDL